MAYTAPMTVTGRVAYMGVAGTIATGNLLATKTVLTGANLKRTTPRADLKDGAGNIISQAYARPTDELQVKFTPLSVTATSTTADAAANVILPAIGSLVTLADTGIAAFDGDWNYMGDASIDTDTAGAVVISMTISRTGDLTGVNPTVLALRT